MCSVFGLLDFGDKLSPEERLRITKALGKAAEVRGTDASGIAYAKNGLIQIQKAPRPAHKMRWKIDPDARYIMGHTRMTTQGSEKRNQNNHPFYGKAGTVPFALAHNGVLYNDAGLRKNRRLPNTKIETDSYVAVQLLEQEGDLSARGLQRMAEALEGSFTITILDAINNLYFVKGNNPLTILLLPKLDCYLYASTEEILRSALKSLSMADVKTASVKISQGDILRIDAKGYRTMDRFNDSKLYCDYFSLWPYWSGSHTKKGVAEKTYLDELKAVASAYGYSPDMIDRLSSHGFTTEEIEEFLYEGSSLTCGYY